MIYIVYHTTYYVLIILYIYYIIMLYLKVHHCFRNSRSLKFCLLTKNNGNGEITVNAVDAILHMG